MDTKTVTETSERDGLVKLAKLAEQTDRYEDVKNFMKQVIDMGGEGEISADERGLLSIGYKQVVGPIRVAVRIVSTIEEKGNASESLQQVTVGYREQLQNEVKAVCNECVELLDKHLISKAADPESKVFYLKMKGDYLRYSVEVARVGAEDVIKKAHDAYQEAYDIAKEKMESTHPIFLGLVLNYSVFFYEIVHDNQKAVELAKTCFEDAVSGLGGLGEDDYKDSSMILQLLRDNLSLWASEMGAPAEGHQQQDLGENEEEAKDATIDGETVMVAEMEGETVMVAEMEVLAKPEEAAMPDELANGPSMESNIDGEPTPQLD